MPRQANPENVYALTCVVTQKTVPTNPKQHRELMDRYNCSADELANSYVSREGRQIIKKDKMTKDEAMQKYNILPNVANQLKCFYAEKMPKVKRQKTVDAQVEATPTKAVDAQESQPESTESNAEQETVFIASEIENEAEQPV